MITALIALGVLLAIVLVLGLWVAGIYNKLVELRNRFKNAFAQIDVQLKRRYDLIPNLVEVAKGYMKHESSTLEAVIKARNIALAASQAAAANPADANAMKGLMSAEAGLGGALKKIGGLALGSSLQTSKSAAIGHFFFAQSFRSNFGGLWATHPPLDERIRAIDPQFNGQMIAPPDVTSMAVLFAVIYPLYEVSIWIIVYFEKQAEKQAKLDGTWEEPDEE